MLLNYMLPLWLTVLPIREVYQVSKNVGVCPDIVLAIMSEESGGRDCATRYEDHFTHILTPEKFATPLGITLDTEIVHQKTSWGLMQIMGAVARELHYKDHLPGLCDSILNIQLGSMKILELKKKYKLKEDVISSYNAGSPRKARGKQTYVNQHYVDRVISKYNEIKELRRVNL